MDRVVNIEVTVSPTSCTDLILAWKKDWTPQNGRYLAVVVVVFWGIVRFPSRFKLIQTGFIHFVGSYKLCIMDREEILFSVKYKCTYSCDVTGSATMEMRMWTKMATENQTSICDIKVF